MENIQQKPATAVSASPAHPTPQHSDFRRSADFASFYSNNVAVESNAFDLKLVLGVLDLRNAAKPAVDQFAAVILSWPEVKLVIYWMQLHLAAHENENGKVKIPDSALPPEIPAVIPPQFDNPKGREAFELMRRSRAAFIASLTES